MCRYLMTKLASVYMSAEHIQCKPTCMECITYAIQIILLLRIIIKILVTRKTVVL